MPTLRDLVEGGVARRHAAQLVVGILGILYFLDGLAHQVLHRVVAAPQVVLTDLEKVVFGLVEQVEHIGGVFKGFVDHVR